jgi:hypothetical protein
MSHVGSEELVVHVANDFGRHLIGREIGAAIRRKHFSDNPSDWPRAIDFGGVVQATESCIDELFGTLSRSHGVEVVERISITGASQPVREAIEYVFLIVKQPPIATNEIFKRILSGPPQPAMRKPRRGVLRKK